MRITHRLLIWFALLALAGMLAYGSSQQPGAKSKPAAPAPPPAGWKTVTNDTRTCKLSLPPKWTESPPGSGMFSGPQGTEMVMFIEDEETAKAGNWDPVRKEIERKKATGVKVEILEDTPASIIFQAPQGSVLAVMSFRRSPKTLCALQIGVPAGDPAQQKVAKQIAQSLAPMP